MSSQEERSLHLNIHIVGDAFVDLFCFLEHELPEVGGDALLGRPIVTMAGGSGINTATHLSDLVQHFSGNPHVRTRTRTPTNKTTTTTAMSDTISATSTTRIDRNSSNKNIKSPVVVVELQTVLNPNDEYGQLLMGHAEKYGFSLVNCNTNNTSDVNRSNKNHSTGHCVVIVSHGERSFLTHQGCVGKFKASDMNTEALLVRLPPPLLVRKEGDFQKQQQTNNHCLSHIHIAGYYNLKGFWNGALLEKLKLVKDQQVQNYPTTISLVPQYDATGQWDGQLLHLIPLLDFLIMNELEVEHITKQLDIDNDACTNGGIITQEKLKRWATILGNVGKESNAGDGKCLLTCSNTCFVVTLGWQGAVAFRGGQIIASQAAYIVEHPVDSTGAGDAFIAGFLHGIWSFKMSATLTSFGEIDNQENHKMNWPTNAIQHGLLWGCSTGTCAVKVRGASVPSFPNEIQKLVDGGCV